MEATALSVGKAVLDGAVDYAKSIVAEEISLQLGVEGDVSFITDELEMMQSFLMTTANEEQDKHKVMLTWVKQVREVAYNVEDSLMDFSHHSEKKPFCWWCIIPGTLWERRNIANELKQLRTKVEDVSNRNLRYRLIKGTGSKPTTTAKDQTDVGTESLFGISEARFGAMDQEHSKVDLHHLITNDDKDLRVIAVWGTSGDLGKMSPIMETYQDQEVHEKFGCRAWVRLTSPFNPCDFFHNLLRQFYVYSRVVTGKTIEVGVAGYDVLKELEKMDQNIFADKVSEFFAENRYLIVIDNLTTIVEWQWIKTYFPNKKNGSRIIVSTQQVEVASLCTEQPYQVTELKQISYDHSIYLFHNKVEPRPMKAAYTDGNNSEMPSGSSEIVEKTHQKMGLGGGNLERKLLRSKTIAIISDDLVGRINEKSDIINLINEDDGSHSCRVISVWGMGGVGKTTLIQSVYRSQCFSGRKRAWVTALRPFNQETIIRSLVSQLQKGIQEDAAAACNKMQKNRSIPTMGFIAELSHLLDQDCLIVVDDLSYVEEWNSIKEYLLRAGCVIVTTREKNVAMHCSRELKNMYSLQGLEDTAAFDLFKKKVFKDNNEKVDLRPDMMEQARHILKGCDRLPLAISTIGGFLATKLKTTAEWRLAYDRISINMEINPELRTMKTVLVRSYDGLPYHIKSCFLYLSIFPEDHKIRRKRVVQRWVAEGYSREIMHGMTEEEVGDMYFDGLLDRSMILPGEEVNIYSGKINSCQLHDIMRQICMSKAREENLVLTLEEGCSLSSAYGVIRHLAISSSWKRDKCVFQEMIDLSHVRSLTVFGGWREFFISNKMRFLRVLDLEDNSEVQNHHLRKIAELINLKYLSLRGCQTINQLPSSFGNLRHLQTLDIEHTRIFKLPSTITKLRKLKFLHATRVSVPRGIRKLNALHTLGGINVTHGKVAGTVKGFKHLNQLRKLGIIDLQANNSEEFWSAIANLNHLQSLAINWKLWGDNFDYALGESLLPPKCIESLKLGGQPTKLKEWIHQLNNLSRLQLLRTKLHRDAIQVIGKLPNLAILDMRYNSFEGGQLPFEHDSFRSLMLMALSGLNDVAFVQFENGSVPNLELLQAAGWEGLQEFTGLRWLTKLKEIQLGPGTSEEFKANVKGQVTNWKLTFQRRS